MRWKRAQKATRNANLILENALERSHRAPERGARSAVDE
jgi:hypothetical protein